MPTTSRWLALALSSALIGCSGFAPAPSDCASNSDCPIADGSASDSTQPTIDASSDSAIENGEAASDASHEGATTDAGGCVAPKSLECNGVCVDPSLPAHCGSCTKTCLGPDGGSGEATCTNGTCGLGCSGSTSLDCSGACVNPTTTANCGGCGNVCPGPSVGNGAAQCLRGSDGGPECSVVCAVGAGSTSQLCGSSCYDPNDVHHCGSCSNDCSTKNPANSSATCSSASNPVCGFSCNSGYHACAQACDLNSDVPSTASDPCIVSEAFGVFVAPAPTGNDANAGSQLAPVATLGHAMDLAKLKPGLSGPRVYACGSAGNFTAEHLVVGAARDGVALYGGLDCTTTPSQWTYNANDKATLAPSTQGYALQVQSLSTGVTFEDFGFVSMAGTAAGQSSIAVFASNSSGVVLRRCNVQAGAGFQGLDQSQPAAYTTAAPGGNPGTASAGGMAVPNPNCPSSIGGTGGSPVAGGQPGSDGQPGPPTNPSNGDSVLECQTLGAGGKIGAGGLPGAAAGGAAAWATFSAAGWAPAAGVSGGAGTVGQGGGGGASSGPVSNGGGSGAAGGCGGAGGPAGTGGGSSIAVLLFDAIADLESSTLATAGAGRGGNGAAGQTGQSGGPGTTASAECKGGAGGPGGDGGSGGGGAGGLSVGVLWVGTAPTFDGASTPSAGTLAGVTTGAAGSAGTGGQNNAKAGTQGAIVQFQ